MIDHSPVPAAIISIIQGTVLIIQGITVIIHDKVDRAIRISWSPVHGDA